MRETKLSDAGNGCDNSNPIVIGGMLIYRFLIWSIKPAIIYLVILWIIQEPPSLINYACFLIGRALVELADYLLARWRRRYPRPTHPRK